MGEVESCLKCGTCVQMCPTGALSFHTILGKDASWDYESLLHIFEEIRK